MKNGVIHKERSKEDSSERWREETWLAASSVTESMGPFCFLPSGTHENVYDIFTVHKYKSISVSTAKKFQLKHILCARPCACNASSLPKALLAQYYGELFFLFVCF